MFQLEAGKPVQLLELSEQEMAETEGNGFAEGLVCAGACAIGYVADTYRNKERFSWKEFFEAGIRGFRMGYDIDI